MAWRAAKFAQRRLFTLGFIKVADDDENNVEKR